MAFAVEPGDLRISGNKLIPAHSGETIGPGLLHKILRDCQLSANELWELLTKAIDLAIVPTTYSPPYTRGSG